MAREKADFRPILEMIIKEYPDHECLTPGEVARWTGLSVRAVGERFTGWTGKSRGKTITRTRLAMELAVGGI